MRPDLGSWQGRTWSLEAALSHQHVGLGQEGALQSQGQEGRGTVKGTHFLAASEEMEKAALSWGSLREEPLVLTKDHGGGLEGWLGKLLADVLPLGASGLTPRGRHRPGWGTV